MPKTKINETGLYYELHGKGEPLVLIAGYACDISFWQPIIESLAKNFKVLIFDNRGAGRSDSPDSTYSIEMMAQDVVGLMDEAGFPTAHVLGHSMGGAIAQRIAYAYPTRVKKLVIVNSCAKFSAICTMISDFFVTLRKEGIPDERVIHGTAPWLFSASFLANPNNLQQIADQMIRNPYHQSLIGQRRQCEALANFDSTKWMKQIKAPTLILASEEDLLCPAKDYMALAKGIADSQLFIFEDQAHVPSLERPVEFTQVVSDFLNRKQV